MNEELNEKRELLLADVDALLSEVFALQTPQNEGSETRFALDEAQLILEGLRGKIVTNQLTATANAIKEDAGKLKTIAAAIKEKADDLDSLSDKFNTAASVAGTVAELAGGLG